MMDEDQLEIGTPTGEPASGQALAPMRAEPASMLALIGDLARDPAVDVSKLAMLVELQGKLEDRQRAAEFSEALARLQPSLPRIKKNGSIEIPADTAKQRRAATIKFAKWEDIDAAIRQLLADEGFGLSFFTAQRPGEGGGLVVTARLRHRNGHFEEASIPVPLDTGPGRNNLQAYGSTLSYGKRYAACAILNIITEGEDKDGTYEAGENLITPAQLTNLAALLVKARVSAEAFCQKWGIAAVADLKQSHLNDAMNGLVRRANKLQQPGGDDR